MKVAVIKLGSRISFNANDTSGGNGEARSIIKMLHEGGAEVHIFTKILKKDNLVPEYHWHDLTKILNSSLESRYGRLFSGLPSSYTQLQRSGQPFNPSFDALVVLNGNVNFFGGAEDPEQLLNYAAINNFGGPVYYILCDPELTLKQVWPSVEKKEWASNWSDSLLNITRNDITFVSQPHDVEKVLAELGNNEVKPAKIVHYPFEKFPCLNVPLAFNENPKVDLSYGGTMRGGKRIAKMLKFYFDHPSDISVEMFGKIDEEDFLKHKKYGPQATKLTKPKFTGPVRYDEMLPKMNEAMAHCVIGDPWYEEINDMAQRCYESIWSSVVTFIDHDLDKLRRVYGADKELSDFLYVKTREELSEKIQLLKTDVETRREIVQAQFLAVGFDPKKYCESFVNLIKG